MSSPNTQASANASSHDGHSPSMTSSSSVSSAVRSPVVSTPFWKTLVAGGGAGLAEVLVMYPTDVVKTRMQLATRTTTATTERRLGTVGMLRQIMAQEGVRTLYRGLSSPIFAEAPKRAIKFASNDKLKTLLSNDKGQLTNARSFVAGGLAGFLETFINCPFESIKIQMQQKGSKAMYASTSACLIKIVKDEGVFRGLYKGFEPMALRNTAFNAVYFGIIGSLQAALPLSAEAKKSHPQVLAHKFTIGAIAGFFGVLCNTPLDVCKSRMQAATAASKSKYVWTIPSLALIAKEEGVKSLYSGLGPRLIRLSAGGGIMLVGFDTIMGWIK